MAAQGAAEGAMVVIPGSTQNNRTYGTSLKWRAIEWWAMDGYNFSTIAQKLSTAGLVMQHMFRGGVGADLFLQYMEELAVLVIDQGTILDRIDFNMEQVVEHVEEGIKQLEKAEEYQKSARPKWCIAILLFLITCLLVFLVLKHRKKDKHDDDDK